MGSINEFRSSVINNGAPRLWSLVTSAISCRLRSSDQLNIPVTLCCYGRFFGLHYGMGLGRQVFSGYLTWYVHPSGWSLTLLFYSSNSRAIAQPCETPDKKNSMGEEHWLSTTIPCILFTKTSTCMQWKSGPVVLYGLSGWKGIVVACVSPSFQLFVRPCVRKLCIVRTMTRHKFELESPNLQQTCIFGFCRLVLKMGSLTLIFKVIWPFWLHFGVQNRPCLLI